MRLWNCSKFNKNNGTKEKKKQNCFIRKIKPNSIEDKISKALAHIEISHEDFVLIDIEAESESKPKESIRMMESQRSGIRRDKLIQGGKIMGMDEMIKENEK